MSYTVHFFAHEGKAFAERLQKSPAKVIQKVESWATSRKIHGRKLEHGMKCVHEICRGDLGNPSREDYFWALCWIGDALMERIRLPEFSELKHYSYIEEYGVVPGLLRHPAPYRLPRAKDVPPAAGYLPWTEMESFCFEGLTEVQQEVRKQLERGVNELFAGLSRELFGQELPPPHRQTLPQGQIDFARQQFKDVLETLVEDKLDLLAVIV